MHPDSTSREGLTVAALRTMAERGIERRPELTSRIEKAALIVLMRRMECLGETWLVESEAEIGKSYAVTSDGCSCPDSPRAPLGMCKHRLAVGLVVQAERDGLRLDEQTRRARLSDERVAVNFGLAFAGVAA